jgi:outer membrane protein
MKMKTVLMALVAMLMAAAVSGSVFAADKPNVGYVDLEKIVKSHPMLIKWNKEIETIKSSREKIVEKQIKDKFGITKQMELTDKQRSQVQQFIMEENQKFAAEMEPKQAEKMKKAEKDIKEAAAVIAADKKLDLVLDRMVVVFGGIDITDAVIEKIKQKTK